MKGDQASPAAPDPAATRRGILFMLGSQALFIVSDSLSKSCIAEVPTGEILVIRGIFTVALTGTVAVATGALRHIRASYSGTLAIRNLAELCSSLFFFSALFQLPLANVTSIYQTMPLVMVLALALVFGQRIDWKRWVALAAGFIGVLLIVRPGTEAFTWWSVTALVGVFFAVIRDIATGRLAKDVPTPLVTFLTAMIVAVTGFLIGLTETWAMPSAGVVAKLGAAGTLVVIGSNMLITALRSGDIVSIIPFRHSAVLWALLMGYVVLGELPDRLALIGGAVIVLAGLHTLRRAGPRPKPDRPAP